jgi:hypothetical protein
MLNFVPGLCIYLHTKPIDMRKSFDALFGIVSAEFGRDVREGGHFCSLINHVTVTSSCNGTAMAWPFG